MKQKEAISALRFPEFHEKWDVKPLDQLMTKIGDGLHSTPVYDELGEYFFINGNNLVDGRIVITESTKKVNKTEYAKHKIELDDKSILLSINGTIGSLALYNKEKVVLGKSACYLNVSSAADRLFVFNLLQTAGVKNHFFSELTGSTIKNLSLSTIRNARVHIPRLPEQQKIAAFLSAVDRKIEQLTRKMEFLLIYKKGVMRQIFSRKIRFKKDDGNDFPEWEEKTLGEWGSTYNGLIGKTADDFGEGSPYITYKQTFDNSTIQCERFGFVRIDPKEKQNRVNFGDVFFTTSSETPGEVAFASVILDEVETLYLNSFCFGFRPHSLNTVRPQFSRYLFRSDGFRRKVFRLAQGSTRYNISKTEMMKLPIALPSPDEQMKIAAFLSAIDEKIEHLDRKLENTRTFKIGLLQQMFV